MRLDHVRFPLAGALLLAAAGLTFAWGTNWNGGVSDAAATTASLAPASLAERDARPERTFAAVALPAAAHPARVHATPVHATAAHLVALHKAVAARATPAHATAAHLVVPHQAVAVARHPLSPVRPPTPRPTSAASRKSAATTAVPTARVAILRFVGSPRTIVRGGSVTLCATANGATRLRLVPVAPLDPRVPNCRIIRPHKTTTYTLLAQGPAGDEVTQNVTIVVHKHTAPPAQPPDYGP